MKNDKEVEDLLNWMIGNEQELCARAEQEWNSQWEHDETEARAWLALLVSSFEPLQKAAEAPSPLLFNRPLNRRERRAIQNYRKRNPEL